MVVYGFICPAWWTRLTQDPAVHGTEKYKQVVCNWTWLVDVVDIVFVNGGGGGGGLRYMVQNQQSTASARRRSV